MKFLHIAFCSSFFAFHSRCDSAGEPRINFSKKGSSAFFTVSDKAMLEI